MAPFPIGAQTSSRRADSLSEPAYTEYISGRFHTADISTLVKQDVLLLAGSEDHYVPVEQFYQQIKMLPNARSITARLFTRNESAENHCQVGN